MVEARFDLFFQKNITKYAAYQKNTLHLIGSVAFVYQNIFKAVAEKYNVKIGKVIQQPIEELVKYHLKENMRSNKMT
jgi:hypothetical protein